LELLIGISRRLDAFSQALGRLSGWVVLALTLVTVSQVIARYVFNASSVGMQELEWHLFGAVFLLAGAYTLKEEGHVRVDVFYARMSLKAQALVNIAGLLFFLLPTCAIVIYFGYSFTVQSWAFTNPRPDDYYSADWGILHSVLAPLEGLLRRTILIGEISPDPGGLEARWLAKALIPLGFFFLALQGLSGLIKNTAVLFDKSTH
jgi:TRAP-type mannitol/chloroaromatic compound transport system permease small subunit